MRELYFFFSSYKISFLTKYIEIALHYCPVLIASTGLSLAADDAGIIPESKPTTNEIPKPIATFLNDSTKLNPSLLLGIIKVSNHTKNNPKSPPIIAKSTASNKN